MANKAAELPLLARVEQLDGKKAILACWESLPKSEQGDHREYIRELKARIRQISMYILHRKEDLK
jgi:hypothetical protein